MPRAPYPTAQGASGMPGRGEGGGHHMRLPTPPPLGPGPQAGPASGRGPAAAPFVSVAPAPSSAFTPVVGGLGGAASGASPFAVPGAMGNLADHFPQWQQHTHAVHMQMLQQQQQQGGGQAFPAGFPPTTQQGEARGNMCTACAHCV